MTIWIFISPVTVDKIKGLWRDYAHYRKWFSRTSLLWKPVRATALACWPWSFTGGCKCKVIRSKPFCGTPELSVAIYPATQEYYHTPKLHGDTESNKGALLFSFVPDNKKRPHNIRLLLLCKAARGKRATNILYFSPLYIWERNSENHDSNKCKALCFLWLNTYTVEEASIETSKCPS